MNTKITNNIKSKLHEIEKEHNVEILYAIESGSRAWGFESIDSDYDVRFIYKHKIDWYLKITQERDVIEYPVYDIYDFSGWDIRKALFLFSKSNPVLFEWLNSPIIYKKNKQFHNSMLSLSQHYFNPVFSIYHYLHMAKRNYKDYLCKDLVIIKKYFYVLRPILACKWIDEKNETPPMEFEILIKQIKAESIVYKKVYELLIKKRNQKEIGKEKIIPEINDYLKRHILYFENKVKEYEKIIKPDIKILDEFFVKLLFDK